MNEQQAGEALKKKRGDRSVRSVAKAAGITPAQIASIEKATRAYTFRTLLALAKEVGANVEIK